MIAKNRASLPPESQTPIYVSAMKIVKLDSFSIPSCWIHSNSKSLRTEFISENIILWESSKTMEYLWIESLESTHILKVFFLSIDWLRS